MKKILLGMSGGVDSSAAALLLKQAGYDVTGVTLRLYDNADLGEEHTGKTCCSLKDVEGSMVYVGNGEKINVGNFKADPCELPKGSSKALATVYISLDEELSLLKIFTMARNFQLEDYVVNASGVVKTGGISRKLSFKDIPLRKFIDKTYRKK